MAGFMIIPPNCLPADDLQMNVVNKFLSGPYKGIIYVLGVIDKDKIHITLPAYGKVIEVSDKQFREWTSLEQ